MRRMAIDPGEKRFGIALSDPGGRVAFPSEVIQHVSFAADVERITRLIQEQGVETVVVGLALGSEGEETASSRRSRKLARAIQEATGLQPVLFDESGTTRSAQQAAIKAGVPRRKRGGHLDAVAAAVLLQEYLESLA